MADRNTLLAGIAEGKNLKKTEVVDKSAPIIEKVTVKKIDRGGFLTEVAAGKELKHAETKDLSVPSIEKEVKVKKSERPALMGDIQKGIQLKKA